MAGDLDERCADAWDVESEPRTLEQQDLDLEGLGVSLKVLPVVRLGCVRQLRREGESERGGNKRGR